MRTRGKPPIEEMPTEVHLNFSVHVEIALEDTLLERIGLARLRGGLGRSSVDGGDRHVGDGLGSIVVRGGGSPVSRRGARHGEGGARGPRDGAFGSRPKLLGPVEALLV